MAADKMSHAEIVKRIGAKARIARKYVKEVLAAATEVAREELLAGRKFNLINLGILKPVVRPPRVYRGPWGGPGRGPLSDIKKPAEAMVNFRPGKDLKRAIRKVFRERGWSE